ncbi:MAG: glycosyl hydrolase family 18 protein [Candidatus Limnocylindrales bacterium]
MSTLPSRLRNRLPNRRTIGRSVTLGLGLVVLIGLAPGSRALAASPKRATNLQPTIHYEDARAHAGDRIAFKPGARASVPFRPRASDTWQVGGRRPQILPAGRVSGRAMRAATPAQASVDASIDRPQLDPNRVVAAVDAGWDASAGPADVELTARVDPGALRREVFGFLPYWELGASSTRLDWTKLSTVAYFGVGADAAGNLQKRNPSGSTTVGWSGWTSSRMTDVLNRAHASGTRVVLTVQSFAWSSAGRASQASLLGSSTAQANLAAQISRAVRDRGADGVNLDFEPLTPGYADEFTALVRKVRSSLDASARGYQLTFDTTGYIGNYPIEAATAAGGADAIMIMGYDYRTAGSSVAGSIAPIGGPTYDIADTLGAYLARVPASKLILGVPYYGRAWSTESSALHARTISGAKYGSSSSATYVTAQALAAQNGRRYDTLEGAAWTAYRRAQCTATYGCVNPWRQLYYDDAAALGRKYDLVNSRGLRGVGIWALGYDGTRTELYGAIQDKFIADSAAPIVTGASLTSAYISPNGDGRADVTTARLTATALVRWGYRIQPLEGATALASVRSGSVIGKTPVFTWNGREADGSVVADGVYRLTLWVADASGNRAGRTFTVVVDTRSPRVSPTISRGYLSPDGNDHTDRLRIGWTSSQATRGRVGIINAAGTTVRTWSFGPSRAWWRTWDGRSDGGTTLPDGRYTYRVKARDLAGNQTIVERTIALDRTIRRHSWSDPSFDPRDGRTSRLTVELRRSATVNASIYLGTTRVRRIWLDTVRHAGTYGWTWNGRTASGAYARPGRYRIVLSARSSIAITRWTRYVTIEAH